MSDKQIILGEKEYIELSKYLLQHEQDISYEIDDYGDLWDLFTAVFERRPLNNTIV